MDRLLIQELDGDLLAALLTAQHRAQQSGRPFYLIGAGLPNVPAILTDAKSYAERMFEYSVIGPLPDDLAREALAIPARSSGVRLSVAALDVLVEASGGYPYFLQELGRAVWNLAPDRTVSESDARAAVDVAFAELDAGFYPGRWDKATPAEQEYLAALAEVGDEAETAQVATRLGKKVSTLGSIRERLVRKGILYSPRRGVIAFTVPGMAAYIGRNSR